MDNRVNLVHFVLWSDPQALFRPELTLLSFQNGGKFKVRHLTRKHLNTQPFRFLLERGYTLVRLDHKEELG